MPQILGEGADALESFSVAIASSLSMMAFWEGIAISRESASTTNATAALDEWLKSVDILPRNDLNMPRVLGRKRVGKKE